MKKLMMVIICLVIITVFVAFNYLLWERDINIKNYEKLSESKAASIDTLGEKIKALDDVNKQQKIKLDEFEMRNNELDSQNIGYVQEIEGLNKKIIQKDNLIYELKKIVDIKPIEDSIKKWIEGIDKGNYEQSYNFLLNGASNEDYITLNDFMSDYKGVIKRMKLKSVKLYNNEDDIERKGDVIFDVIIDVEKNENVDISLFDNGENERFFTMEYNKDKETWLISYISRTP